MAHENNDAPNPFIDPLFAFAQGSDSDGVPYSEYNFTPPVSDNGYYYIRTLVDTRDNTVTHIAVVGRDRPEECGTYVKYATLRHGLFIHRVPVPQEEVSWVACFADNRNAYKLTKAIIDADRPSLDFDGDDPITRADTLKQLILEISHSPREVQLETLEKWVGDNGGLYNALRRLVVFKPIELDEIPQSLERATSRSEFAERRRWLGERHIPRLDIKDDDSIAELLKEGIDKTDPAYLAAKKATLFPPLPETLFPVIEQAKKDNDDDKPVDGNTLALLNMFNHSGMTLDEAKVISDLTDPEQKVKVMEAWLAKRGGMGRINEAALSRALFGPVLGSKERIHDADLETAKRLCKDIVRSDKGGLDINYGRLAVGHLEGLPFLGRIEYLEQLGVRCLYISKVPQFIQDTYLTVSWGREVSKGDDSHYSLAAVTVWALEKEDIAPLGLALSKKDRRVVTGHKDYCLQEWVNGVCTQPHQTIDAFLPDQTDQDIENSRY